MGTLAPGSQAWGTGLLRLGELGGRSQGNRWSQLGETSRLITVASLLGNRARTIKGSSIRMWVWDLGWGVCLGVW